MSYKKSIPLAITAIAAGTGILWLVRRRSQEVRAWSVWQRVLAEKHGATKAQQMIERVRQRYSELLAERPLPANPALRRHASKNILPGLALYQALLQENGGDRQAALAEVDEAFRAWVLANNRLLLAPLKILPKPFWLFKLAFNERMKAFPAEGWYFEYVENSDDRIAFNATRCFYLNTLTAYGAPELTASFCKGDDVQAELFPPSVRFVRSHTLGRGDEVCDFQYCHVQQP